MPPCAEKQLVVVVLVGGLRTQSSPRAVCVTWGCAWGGSGAGGGVGGGGHDFAESHTRTGGIRFGRSPIFRFEAAPKEQTNQQTNKQYSSIPSDILDSTFVCVSITEGHMCAYASSFRVVCTLCVFSVWTSSASIKNHYIHSMQSVLP